MSLTAIIICLYNSDIFITLNTTEESHDLKVQANIDLPMPNREIIPIEDEDDIYIYEEEEEIDELESYLEERRSNIKVKPLDYWTINRDRYPILSLLVRRYLQIPATSAPSERFFSLGALIINKLRNRLSKDTFEEISLLKSWGFIFDLKKRRRR
ncbi:uncharacterized protein RAG0_14526 [Rhynchosporium agropyri]|uniref:HAT C-terminal dimerisation domain-containing protein n=1 Tax=Rhynchosporium agropyri TaxID=914238 RepID=A0A1E1LHC4_9HELO|nr:uncharacterized protein RAG0_14526 [Rhynchosporium agropyri]